MALGTAVTDTKSLNVSLIKLWKNNNFKDYYAQLYLQSDGIATVNADVSVYIMQLRNAYLSLLRAEVSMKALIDRVKLYRDYIKDVDIDI